MKLFFSIFSLFGLFLQTNAQVLELENNSNWSNYKAVVKKKDNKIEHVYQLDNGIIDVVKSYSADEIVAEYKYIYDEKGNLKQLLIKYPIKNDRSDQVVDFDIKYDKQGLKIQQNDLFFVYDKNNKLVRRFSNLYKESNGEKGKEDLFFYDNSGNLSRKESTSFEKGVKFIDVEEYIYDDCNNVKQIARSSNPKRNYPIVILGNDKKNEIDLFEYEYDENCIWVKKFSIQDGERKLLSERELIEKQ